LSNQNSSKVIKKSKNTSSKKGTFINDYPIYEKTPYKKAQFSDAHLKSKPKNPILEFGA
jgi:hypothetical protein